MLNLYNDRETLTIVSVDTVKRQKSFADWLIFEQRLPRVFDFSFPRAFVSHGNREKGETVAVNILVGMARRSRLRE